MNDISFPIELPFFIISLPSASSNPLSISICFCWSIVSWAFRDVVVFRLLRPLINVCYLLFSRVRVVLNPKMSWQPHSTQVSELFIRYRSSERKVGRPALYYRCAIYVDGQMCRYKNARKKRMEQHVTEHMSSNKGTLATKIELMLNF